MQVIFDWFLNIGEGLLALIDFIVKMVGDLIYVVGLLGELLPAMPAFFTWLPPGAVALVVTTIGVLVILRVVGRSD